MYAGCVSVEVPGIRGEYRGVRFGGCGALCVRVRRWGLCYGYLGRWERVGGLGAQVRCVASVRECGGECGERGKVAPGWVGYGVYHNETG